MILDELVKNPKWTWRTDVKYYAYYLPIEILWALIGIARRENIINNMTWRDYIDLAYGTADMKAGRWYSYKAEK